MPDKKDTWDKIEISAKIIGAIFVPIVVGGVALFWNNQVSKRAAAASLTTVAIGVLEKGASGLDSTGSALMTWAVSVLQNPTHPPKLSDPAALDILEDGMVRTPFGSSINSETRRNALDKLRKRLRDTEQVRWSLASQKSRCDGAFRDECRALGMMYEDGISVKPDYELSKKYYERGCELGDDYSCDAVKDYQGLLFGERWPIVVEEVAYPPLSEPETQ